MHGLKFSFKSTTDHTGTTKALLGCVMDSESLENFTWLGECFERIFREPPRVLLTDDDPHMIAAFTKLWPSPRTVHVSCIWHLSKCARIWALHRL